MKRHNYKPHQHKKIILETVNKGMNQTETKEAAKEPPTVNDQLTAKEKPKVIEPSQAMHLNEPSNADNPLVIPINAQAVAESVEAGGLLQTAAAAIQLNIPKIEVTGPSDYEGHCLTCSFECKTEKELDIHMANDHQVPMPLPIAVHPCGRPCNDCETKETVITANIKKVERLEFKITDLVTQLKMVKTVNVNLVKQKENREKDYQEATRVIGDQQRKVTESTEKIIVLEGLAKVEAEKKGC